MKKFVLTATLLATTLPVVATVAIAQSQPQSQGVSGFSVLVAIAKLKGLILTEAQIAQIIGNANPTPGQLGPLAATLGISTEALNNLVTAGTTPMPPAQALQAVLEAATGEKVSLDAVQQLIEANPGIAQAVATLEKVSELVNNPVAATQLANRAEEIANSPVTPRGGGL